MSVKLRRAVLWPVLMALAVGGRARAQTPPPIEVMHSWTSTGEHAAVDVLIAGYRRAGGQWRDVAVAGFENVDALVISRILGGQPPGAAHFVAGPVIHDLVKWDLLLNLDDVARAGDWKAKFPPLIYRAVSQDGHVYGVPFNIRVQNLLFYSLPVLKRAGVRQPPRDWDELFAAFDRIRQAGAIPLALGGQPWQEHMLFDAVLLSRAGADIYNRVYIKRDASAVRSPAFLAAVRTFARLRGYVDAGASGRNWNDATALVTTHKAGMQFMGDWALAEFAAAGQVAGRDFGCLAGVNDRNVIIGSDMFVLPAGGGAGQAAAQKLLATVALSPAMQLDFNRALGGLPVRLDLDTRSLGPCSAMLAPLVADSRAAVPTSTTVVTPDLNGELRDVITEFWSDPAMRPETMVERFARIIETAT